MAPLNREILKACNPQPTDATGFARLPLVSMINYEKCNRCGMEGCTIFCFYCSFSRVGEFRTFYCSRDCQIIDCFSHQESCNQRQLLVRAVSVITHLWEFFEKKTFTKHCKITSLRDKIIDYEVTTHQAINRAWVGGPIFIDTSENICYSDEIDERIRSAILYHNGCKEPLRTGYEILDMFLKPFVRHVQEVEVHVKDPALLVRSPGIPIPIFHTILQITLLRNESFALDITGAQYGWQEKLSPWSTFCTHRTVMETGYGTAQFRGGLHVEDAPYLLLQNATSLTSALHAIRRHLAKGLHANLEANIKTNYNHIINFLFLPPPDFATARQKILLEAQQYLDNAIADMLSRNIGRYYFNQRFQLCVTHTVVEIERLKKVWLTEQEVEEMDSELALKRDWFFRYAMAV